MTDVLDSESAYMDGKATWEEFLTKFTTQFFAPQIKSAMRMVLASLSPEERSQVQPQALNRLEKFLGGKNNAHSQLPPPSDHNRPAPPYNSTGPAAPEANYSGV